MAMIFFLIKCILILLGILMALPSRDPRFANNPPPSGTPSIGPQPPKAPAPLKGVLAPNSRLDEAEVLLQGLVKGPESFAHHDGRIYAGVIGGDIVSFDPDRIEEGIERVTRVGPVCKENLLHPSCGRVLGMAFDPAGDLVFADAHYGLYKFETKTARTTPLVPSTRIVDGARNLITNSLAVAQNGDVFFTVSSTRASIHNVVVEMLSTRPSGRVMKYSGSTGAVTTLLDGVPLANGIALAPDDSFFVFGSSGDSRLWKYPLSGPNAGQTEPFFDPPGQPDNLKPAQDGKGFYLAVFAVENPSAFDPTEILKQYDSPKIALGNFIGNSIRLLHFFDGLAPSTGFAHFADSMLSPEIFFAQLVGAHCLVIRLDLEGKPVESYHSPRGVRKFMSEGFNHGGWIYVGGFHDSVDHVARIRI